MGIKEEMEKLGTEIMGSYDVRAEKIGQIKKETDETLKGSRDLLKNFQDVHQKMSLEQRKNLAKDVENRKEEVSKTLEDTQKMMDDFKVSHSQMSKELKNDLNKFNQEIKSKVSGMLNDFHSTQDELRAELEKVSLSWQQTVSTLQEKRSGVKPIPEVLEKKIIKEKLPEKAKIVEKLSDKEQVLVLIKKHLEGLKLTEIGVELGKDWRWYIPTVKELMGENKIRKETNLYYPV